MTRRNFNRMSLECLESREMMAADAVLAAGVLNITGTEQADAIVVSQTAQGFQVTIQDLASGNTLVQKTFATTAVKSIQVKSFAGDDVVVNNTNTPSTMYGGLGNDLLIGGAAHDVIFGEAGNDLIYGGAGFDVLYGGADNDTLFGEDGDDELWGGAGVNSLVGGLGFDSFNGKQETSDNENTIVSNANNLSSWSKTIQGVSSLELGSSRFQSLSGTDLGSGRIRGLSGTDLGSGR